MRSQVDKTAQYLRDAILDGRLRPNQLLVASEIAAQLGLSRTPIREAIQRLLQEGYVSKLENGMVVVVEHTATEMHELLEVEGHLLVLAATLACERAADGEMEAIQEGYQRIETALLREDFDSWSEAVQDWLVRLVRACGNSVLISMMDNLKVNYWRRQWVKFLRSDDYKNISEHYKAVVQALMERDGAKAEQELRKIDAVMRFLGSGWLAD